MSRSENSTPFDLPRHKRSRHRFFIPFAICGTGIIALLCGLGSLRLSSHEVYVAVPVREMLATGDFITPTYGGLPRLEKPPLAYWSAAVSAMLFGNVSGWTMRLPSVFAALALAAIVGIWAKRWYGDVAGWGAVAAQLTALYVVVQGRRAEVDMQLCLLTTTAMFLIGDQHSDEPRWVANFRWMAVYLLLSLAWLAKFHYGPAMVLIPTIVYLLLRQDWNRFRGLLNPVGILIFTLSVVIWPLLILQQNSSSFDLWKAEAVGRISGELGRQPVWYYVPCVLILMLPWTPYAIAGAGSSLKRAWPPSPVQSARPRWSGIYSSISAGDAREQFLWIWFAVDLLLITLSANKNRQYTLAALPMCSLLVGQQISALRDRERRGSALISMSGAVVFTVLVLLCGIAFSVLDAAAFISLPDAAKVTITIAAIGIAVIVWLCAFRQTLASIYVAAATYGASALFIFGWLAPAIAQPADHGWMNRQIHEVLAGSPTIAVYRLSYHPWYFDADFPLIRIESESAMTERLQAMRHLHVLTSNAELDALKHVGHCQSLKRLVAPDGSDNELCLVELLLESD